MTYGSLKKFLTLCGSEQRDLSSSYNNVWPTRSRRLRQITENIITYFRIGLRNGFILEGSNLPACNGKISLRKLRSRTDLFRKAIVISKAEYLSFINSLELESDPEPSIYLAGSDVLVVLGRTKSEDVVIHISEDASRIDRYARGYDCARDVFGAIKLEHLIPRTIKRLRFGAGDALVQERITGRSVHPRECTESDFLLHIESISQIFRNFETKQREPSLKPESKMLIHLPDVLPPNIQFREEIVRTAGVAIKWIEMESRTTTLSHGDLCHPNVIFKYDDPTSVSGIIDWEQYRENAILGLDTVYFYAIGTGMRSKESPIRILTRTISDEHTPTIQNALKIISENHNLNERYIKMTAIVIWLIHIFKNSESIDKWPPEKKSDWLESPLNSTVKWLANSEPPV